MKSEKKINEIIGGRIRDIRREKRITGAELGKMLNISQQQVSRYERGINSMTIFFLLKISKELHVDFFSLVYFGESDF